MKKINKSKHNSKKDYSRTKNGVVTAIVAVAILLTAVLWSSTSKNDMSIAEGDVSPTQTISSQEIAYDAYANISEKEINSAVTNADFNWDLNNPYYFFEGASIVALVQINSIDGGRSYSDIFEQSTYPYTFGTMTVLETYKGNIESGQKVKYTRLGAILTYEEYYSNLSKPQQEKRDYLLGDEEPPKYMEMRFAGDIEIEAGKTYIAFFDQLTSKNGAETEYVIGALQYGLREVKDYNTETNSISEMRVLNNNTGEWETLDKLVKLQ